MNPLRWFSGLSLAVALATGTALWLQWQAEKALRGEVAALREEHGELVRLRTENRRLVAAQVPEAELARLRDDRAAVVRLRQEIERLRDGLEKRTRATAAAAGPSPVISWPTVATTDREEKLRQENEAKKKVVEEALAAQQKRKQEMLEREARMQK